MSNPFRRPAPNHDAASGVNRVTIRGGRAPTQRDESHKDEQEDTFDQSDDDQVEKFAQMSQKDDSRAPKTKPKPTNKRDKNVRPTNRQDEADDEDVEDVQRTPEPTTGSHALMLLAMSYRMGFIKQDYPHINQYYPDLKTMFSILSDMTVVISNNSLLHEVYPGYTSLALNCYYSHVVYFHILRVRDDNGKLKKIERRCLRAYEQIGPPESWPIATPLIGYIQALGTIAVEGGKYGKILPAIPDTSKLDEKKGLTGLNKCGGIARFPIVPAAVQFLYNYSRAATHFDKEAGYLHPKKVAKLEADAGKLFVGLSNSKKDDKDFQTLVYSAAWNRPVESETDTFMMSTEQKQGIIKRWGIKHFVDTDDLRNLDAFLGLDDEKDPSWIRNLLICSEEVNKFFPGSVNLSTIPLKTRMEMVSSIKVSTKSGIDAVVSSDDIWYTDRRNWRIELDGKVLRQDAQQAYQMASSIMIRPTYTKSVIPDFIKDSFAEREFKIDEDDYFYQEHAPRTEIYCGKMTDPYELALQIIEGKMYDRFGGRGQ